MNMLRLITCIQIKTHNDDTIGSRQILPLRVAFSNATDTSKRCLAPLPRVGINEAGTTPREVYPAEKSTTRRVLLSRAGNQKKDYFRKQALVARVHARIAPKA